jgi:ankyrin repeat protein
MSPLDIDMHGNTAVHQAAASGEKKVLECFLSRGVDVDSRNARGHTPMDLATQPDVK